MIFNHADTIDKLRKETGWTNPVCPEFVHKLARKSKIKEKELYSLEGWINHGMPYSKGMEFRTLSDYLSGNWGFQYGSSEPIVFRVTAISDTNWEVRYQMRNPHIRFHEDARIEKKELLPEMIDKEIQSLRTLRNMIGYVFDKGSKYVCRGIRQYEYLVYAIDTISSMADTYINWSVQDELGLEYINDLEEHIFPLIRSLVIPHVSAVELRQQSVFPLGDDGAEYFRDYKPDDKTAGESDDLYFRADNEIKLLFGLLECVVLRHIKLRHCPYCGKLFIAKNINRTNCYDPKCIRNRKAISARNNAVGKMKSRVLALRKKNPRFFAPDDETQLLRYFDVDESAMSYIVKLEKYKYNPAQFKRSLDKLIKNRKESLDETQLTEWADRAGRKHNVRK